MKKFIWVALTLILAVGMVLAVTSPASACEVGTSPGYWKNHPEAWPAGVSPTGATAATINGTFGISRTPDVTLMAALGSGRNSALFGDPAAAFWRQAVAQYLNEASKSGNTDYIVGLVQAAWGGAKGTTMLSSWAYSVFDTGGTWIGWETHTLEWWTNYLESFNSL
jgi:hypothetical protein